MLRNRIQPEIDKILRPNQNGFRRNRSTTGQILTVRRIIEGVREKNLEACIIFVDFSKAFDSIDRVSMSEIMKAYGIPIVVIRAIMMLYTNTKSLVRSPDGDTEFFDINAGVLQGDTLAPLLFIICLDYVLRTSIDQHSEKGFTVHKSRSRRYPAVTITDADYADDLALFADTCSDAEILVQSLEISAQEIGLRLNEKKTEYMLFNCNGQIKSLNGKNLKQVESFKYLGSEIFSTEKDVKSRIGKAWGALNKLSSIWKSNAKKCLKRNFFRATVETVLLYSSTTWTLTEKLEKKLDGTYTRMLRAIFNKSWRDHPTNVELYGNIPPISKLIRERRVRFAGHCLRSEEEIVSKVLLWKSNRGKTNVGRPTKTYVDQLKVDVDLGIEDMTNAMKDRTVWKRIVEEARATRSIQ